MPKRSERTKRLSQSMVASPVSVDVVATRPSKSRIPRPAPPPEPESGTWLELGHRDLQNTFSRSLIRIDIVEGRLACTGVHLEANGELAGADLRAFPVAAITPMAAAIAQSVNDRLKDVSVSTAKPAGRKGYDEKHYAKVAQMYRQALLVAPKRPIAWMTDRYEDLEDPPSEATVRRWVRHIRRDLPHLLEGEQP